MEGLAIDELPLYGDTVRINVWRSSVPVIIDFRGTRLSLNVPRLSFLVLAYDKIRETFSLSQDQPFSLVRTTSKAETIKAHLPAGLLYDLHMSSGPWTLTISTDRPEDTSVNLETLKASLWNTLKQNEFIRASSTRRIQNLTPSQSLDFSRSMLDLNFSTYWSTGEKFMTVQPDKVRHYPVRIHFSQTCVVQELVPPRIDGGKTTVRSLLLRTVPKLGGLGPSVVDVIIHGITVAWDLEVRDLLDEAQYIDGWLYIVIRLSVTLLNRKMEEEEEEKQREIQAQQDEQISKQETIMEQTFQQLST